MQSRFEFLEDQYPKLAGYGKNAEEALSSDNNICLFNLGRIAETITEILSRYSLIKNLAPREAIEELSERSVIDDNTKRKIKTLLNIKDEAQEDNYDSEMAAEHLITTAQELCEWFAIKEFENKFEFLAELFPPDFIPPLVNLAEIGREAEENLFTNTRYCLICLGDLGEAIVDYLISANSISAQRDHLDRINVLFNLGVIQGSKKDEFHNLRIARNNAVHERYNNSYTSEEEATKLLEQVLKLCQWLFRLVLKSGYIVKGRVSSVNEDSLSVLIGQIPAIVPLNEIPVNDDGNSLKDSYRKGKKYIFRVVEHEGDIIKLSLIEADKDYDSKVADIKRKYEKYIVGQEVKAKIIRINTSSGAFVELKNGLPAKIPSSEIVGRKLYSSDASGTKQIKFDVMAHVKSISPTQYPPMILTLKDDEKKSKTTATKQKNKTQSPVKDLEFITLCRNAGADKILKALDNGANPNASNNKKLSALMEATRYGRSKIVKLLLDAGADANAKNHEGNTALHFAAMQNSQEVLEELINHGADIYAINKKKKMPIDYVRANKKLNNPYVLEILTNEKTQTPVEVEVEVEDTPAAVSYNNSEVVRENEENENSEKEINEGVTPHDIAREEEMSKEISNDNKTLFQKNFLKICRSGSSSEIAEAIAAGVNVNAKNKALSTALMFAARSNTAEAVNLLIEAKAYIDAQDIYGNTALIYAASDNNDDVVDVLIDAGADIELTNTSGFSAYDYGKKNYRLVDTEAIKRLEHEA